MLKTIEKHKEVSAKFLTLIMQQSFTTGRVPSDWLVGKIIPVHKTGNKSLSENFRPISLTSLPCKFMEHIIVKNITKFLEDNNFFYCYQHGFRKGYSCETQLAGLTHDILDNLDTGGQTDAIFLDFSKAFDRVPHRRLFSKLSNLNIDPPALVWIQALLTNRKQYVTVNNTSSSFASVSSGIPQGSVIGPLLFLIFINDLPSNLSSRIRLFADDCIVYRTIRCDSDFYALQSDLDTISEWCARWQLPLNSDKCKVLSFTRVTPLEHSYHLRPCILQRVSSYKYLGLHFSSDMSWSEHISIIVSNANRTLSFLRRKLRHCPVSMKRTVYTTFIRPSLEYASSIWDPYHVTHSSLIEAVQNRAVRFILNNYSHDASVTAMKTYLSLPTLALRRMVSSLCLFHKIFHNSLLSADMLEAPTFISPRMDHIYKVGLKSSHHDYFLHSFGCRAPRLWNALPQNIVLIGDIGKFKEAIYSHIIDHYNN